MHKVSGTRVDYGASVGNKKDQRSSDLKQQSSVSGATNAKVPVNGVQNEAREKNSSVAPTTRKTTSGK